MHKQNRRPVQPMDELLHRNGRTYLALGGQAPSTQESHGLVRVRRLNSKEEMLCIASHVGTHWEKI